MKPSFVFLADGFEEIEALAVVDVMRRAGMDVHTVSIKSTCEVVGAHGIKVVADMIISDCNFNEADWLILPGGLPGASNLAASEVLCAHLKSYTGRIASICASPGVVLAPLGLLEGKEATCYPGFDEPCIAAGATMQDMPVVVADNLITANGPSAALRFALAIVEHTLGADVAQQVGSGMLYYPESTDFYF
ncbi:MAG: DJ-1/PfpI family protein [Muribaculaceae bacterium]|nr:DJ-1/PfpI family protein [Muribaculaceae bacterium]